LPVCITANPQLPQRTAILNVDNWRHRFCHKP
jgi:hypothetical protein